MDQIPLVAYYGEILNKRELYPALMPWNYDKCVGNGLNWSLPMHRELEERLYDHNLDKQMHNSCLFISEAG